MKRRIPIFLGIIFLVVLPYSALADMMDRTTGGDILFFAMVILLIPVSIVLSVLWIITLLINLMIKRGRKVCRFLGYTTLAFIGALCLTIILGKIYYHYFGYGAYKKEFRKWHTSESQIGIIDAYFGEYADKHGPFPTSEEQVISCSRIYNPPGSDENRVMLDGWGTPIECTLKGNKLAVRSAGRDRKFNTKDDLTNTDNHY